MSKDKEADYIKYGEDHLDIDFIFAVGRMTINFSHLEFMLQLLCGMHLEAKQPINQLLVSEYSFKQLVNVTRSLLLKVNIRRKKTYEKIFKEINELEQVRNKLIHSCYGGFENKHGIVRQKHRNRSKGFEEIVELMTAEDIHVIADRMDNLSKSIGKIIFKISSKAKKK